MTSSSLVGLNAYLSILHLPKDGLNGLLLNHNWYDGLPIHVSGYRTKIHLQLHQKTYIVYLLNLLSFYLTYGIFMHFKCILTNAHILNSLMSQKIYQVYNILTSVKPTFKLWIDEETLSLASTVRTYYHYFFMIVEWYIGIYRKKMVLIYHYTSIPLQYTLYCDFYTPSLKKCRYYVIPSIQSFALRVRPSVRPSVTTSFPLFILSISRLIFFKLCIIVDIGEELFGVVGW